MSPTPAPLDENSARRAPRAWELVVEWVEQRILDGELAVGDLLPAERDLAAQLGVGRSAVREAVRTLQASGVVRSSVGAGAAGGTTITGVPDFALTRLLRLHVALGNFPAADVTEVRVSLERLSAQLGCAEVEVGELPGLREIVEAMDDDNLSIAEFNARDTEFHVALAELGQNRLVTDLTIAIRESMKLPIQRGLQGLEDWTVVRALLRQEHHAILAAMEAGDAAGAAELVESHIRSAYGRMPTLQDRSANPSRPNAAE
ncbi:FadR/GntR family transcriptional regulator [Demetria terragena]|uniref:FadR/GntR family transcriptional regulator n=1 Tax=Demetria terragena TaxID=63959 RepID=UPI000364A4C6|nr:FCD domain-containing protein [Demetria terragena]